MVNARPLVIYHAACRDGWCAAWVAWKHFKGEVDFHAGFYGQEPPYAMAEGRPVYLLDFAYKRDQMKRLVIGSTSTVVLDHHKTAEAEIVGILEELQYIDQRQPGDKVIFDMNRSGAGIAWDYFFGEADNGVCCECGGMACHYPGCPSRAPWCVRYVEDRDLWRHALDYTHEVNAYLGAVPFTFEAWEALTLMQKMDAVEAGKAVQLKLRQYCAEVGKNARRVTFEGHTDVPLVNAPQCDISELLDAQITESGAPLAMGWWQRADGMFQYSLRSRGDLDVSVLAKIYGGGGHKNAAGFQVPSLLSGLH